MESRIYLSQPHVTGREREYIDRAFAVNELTLFGGNITEFEKSMSKYLNGYPTLAVNAGTAALHLALRYAGIGPGDYVLCSSLTFAASCVPVLYLGGKPVFVDSDRDSWNMCPKALERALEWADQQGKSIKAAVIVDLYGQPAKYDELLPMLRDRGITVIEDAAEALGSTYRGKKCGTFGSYNAFSFNSNKVITTGGGGMVVSGEQEAVDKMRYWICQAREPLPYYEHKEYGYQYRMSNILAGIGCAQVPMIDTYVQRRREIYHVYQSEFSDLPVEFMPLVEGGESNCWLSVMTMTEDYDPLELIRYLEQYNIESRMVWKPMHLQPIYRDAPYFTAGGEDVSRQLFERGICLPSASVMSEEEHRYVIEKVRNFFDRRKGAL